ncbi:MAG: hypothetical protein KA339_02595 [Candidatus Kapabacteria bacterium]|nr:hypothetical protein [Ignavibacteria bacterium]MBK7411750.1 hypothetical protein [Ignavibacteria bacterium]MBP6509419.1 hypothetical protein [Candidatus Kapabacteria bacterium]
MVVSRQVANDLTLAQLLYGSSATVDGRYRRRIARFENRLAEIVLSCPLSPALGSRRLTSIACLRNLLVGQTLLRAGGTYTNRWHLLAARRAIVYPELMWYAPPIHFALAYYDGFNGRGRSARLELRRGRDAAKEAMHVHDLLELWIHISIPLHRKADKERRKPYIEKARALLAELSKSNTSSVVAMAAARLATTLAQLVGDMELGLYWLDRSRKALTTEGRYDTVALREYHAQRAFIFNTANDYKRGVLSARKVVESCNPDSTDWFNAINVLLRFQLKSGEYRRAADTADLIDSQKTLKRQSADLIAKLKLGMLYARVLSHDTSITIRNVKSNSKQPLDVLMLSAMVYRGQGRQPETIITLESIKSHIDRTRELRRDRPLWLLSRIVSIYARNELSLRNCVLDRRFVRYQRELANYTIVTAVQGVVSPLQWWKVFVNSER